MRYKSSKMVIIYPSARPNNYLQITVSSTLHKIIQIAMIK